MKKHESEQDEAAITSNAKSSTKRRVTQQKRKRKTSDANLEQSSAGVRKKSRTVSNTSSTSTPRKRSKKWYTSYKGALAFALFKVKTWMLRNDGFLDVTLQADKKKYGGSGMYHTISALLYQV
jgi:maltodextrin utilization protein YvdJ